MALELSDKGVSSSLCVCVCVLEQRRRSGSVGGRSPRTHPDKSLPSPFAFFLDGASQAERKLRGVSDRRLLLLVTWIRWSP
jgi:hypothetical protein